jgi:hypothetical protein
MSAHASQCVCFYMMSGISCIGTALTMLPTGKVLYNPLRFLLREGKSRPGIPIQYCTTDPSVKTTHDPPCSHHRSQRYTVSTFHNSAASLSTSRPQMTYLFMKCSVQPLMFSLVRKKFPPNHTGVSHYAQVKEREKTEHKSTLTALWE